MEGFLGLGGIMFVALIIFLMHSLTKGSHF